ANIAIRVSAPHLDRLSDCIETVARFAMLALAHGWSSSRMFAGCMLLSPFHDESAQIAKHRSCQVPERARGLGRRLPARHRSALPTTQQRAICRVLTLPCSLRSSAVSLSSGYFQCNSYGYSYSPGAGLQAVAAVHEARGGPWSPRGRSRDLDLREQLGRRL